MLFGPYINSGYYNLSVFRGTSAEFLGIWEYIRYFGIPLNSPLIDDYLMHLIPLAKENYKTVIGIIHSIPLRVIGILPQVQKEFDARLQLAIHPSHQESKDLFTYPYAPIYGKYQEVMNVDLLKEGDIAVMWDSVKYNYSYTEKKENGMISPLLTFVMSEAEDEDGEKEVMKFKKIRVVGNAMMYFQEGGALSFDSEGVWTCQGDGLPLVKPTLLGRI